MPVGLLHLQQRLEGLDAGVGEHDVDSAPLLLDLLRGAAQLLDLTLIGDQRQPPRAGRLDLTARGRQVLFGGGGEIEDRAHLGGDVDAHDVCAVFGQGDRRRATDTAGGAGDDRDSTLQV
jgi:hypothetical protein